MPEPGQVEVFGGDVSILNVGRGDTKLTFDKNDLAECARAARIVTDMLKRGYVLFVREPDPKGGTRDVRVKKFDPEVFEYIVADFDSAVAAKVDAEQGGKEDAGGKRRGRPRKISAHSARIIAVPHRAGG